MSSDAQTTESSPKLNVKVMMAVLLIGTFIAILNQTLLNIALPKIIEDLGGSIGTAILVTVMTITADNAPIQVKTDAMIHGINNAYLVASLLALAGMLLSFFLKKPQPMLDMQPKH